MVVAAAADEEGPAPLCARVDVTAMTTVLGLSVPEEGVTMMVETGVEGVTEACDVGGALVVPSGLEELVTGAGAEDEVA